MTPDPVNPSHYRSHSSGVECIQITEHMTFNLGNVIKYLWRNGLKDGTPALQDLQKASWYLARELERVKAKTPAKEYPHEPQPVYGTITRKPQPDTFEAHGHTWFKHTPGDPMPCKPDDVVDVLWRKEIPPGRMIPGPSHDGSKASGWVWECHMGYEPEEVVGWRYVGKPQTTGQP